MVSVKNLLAALDRLTHPKLGVLRGIQREAPDRSFPMLRSELGQIDNALDWSRVYIERTCIRDGAIFATLVGFEDKIAALKALIETGSYPSETEAQIAAYREVIDAIRMAYTPVEELS